MKTFFETNRWLVEGWKSESLNNGNGKKSWNIAVRKVVGNGDDGLRSQGTLTSGPFTNTSKNK